MQENQKRAKAAGALGALLAVSLSGCTGDIGTPLAPGSASRSSSGTSNEPGANGSNGTDNGDGTATTNFGACEAISFSCNDDAPAVESSLVRLSRTQYENALRSVLTETVPAAHFDAVWSAVQTEIQALPSDAVSSKQDQLFTSMDQVVTDKHVTTYLQVGAAAGKAMSASTERMNAILACQKGAAVPACVEAFLRRFARLAYRHPPTTDEITFLQGVFAATTLDPAALADVVTVVLSGPQFVYRLELGTTAVAGKAATYELSAHELVTKLALQLWRTAPDAATLMVADQADLKAATGYEALVDRMLNDKRAEAGYRAFAAEWLDPNWVGQLNRLSTNAAFKAFAGDNMPSATLNADMVNEVSDSLAYHTNHGDSIRDWFLSPYSFARTPELADIYGVAPWNGSAEPPRFVEEERAGLLTRAAFLANSSGGTRPVMKGVFIRERILCQSIGSPPAIAADALASAASPPHGASTRQNVEAITSPSGCAGCHAGTINPLGFASENFDALGRLRDAQPLYSDDGKVSGKAELDTSGVPRVCSSDSAPIKDVAEVAQRIADRGNLEACFARQYVRFALGRHEKDATDGCGLEAVRAGLMEGGDLRSAMRAFVMRPEFRRRYIGTGS
jgi:hypothetical protein